jgi:hypothetical protein
MIYDKANRAIRIVRPASPPEFRQAAPGAADTKDFGNYIVIVGADGAEVVCNRNDLRADGGPTEITEAIAATRAR